MTPSPPGPWRSCRAPPTCCPKTRRRPSRHSRSTIFDRSTWGGRTRTASRGPCPSSWNGDPPADKGGTFVTTSRLFLTGIAATGRHGATPGEKDHPQDFVFDLDVEVEVSSDDIAATADYRKLIQTAR